jgi:hypothetical protein
MVKITNLKTEQVAVDVLNVVAGAILFLSPWLFGYAGEAVVAWNAWIFGAVITLVAAGALVSFKPWEEWVNLLAGLWTIVAPWGLAFLTLSTATITHLLVGLVVAIAAGTKLWLNHNRPLSPA